MPAATFRVHGALAAFAHGAPPGEPIARSIEPGQTVKDAIEALGVPHPEVDLVLVDGGPATFGRRLADGDVVDVYGVDRPAALSGLAGLMAPVARPPRFVVDGHLGRLARYLRLAGFDAWYDRDADDAGLARIARDEERILLTRDRGLLKRSVVRSGYLVRHDDVRRQFAEVAARFFLAADAAPFTRCARCNAKIEPVGREMVAERLAGEPRTLRYFDEFGRCTGCGAVYWRGSHFERMRRFLLDALGEVQGSSAGLLASAPSDTLPPETRRSEEM